MVADGADVVLRLPHAAAADASAGMERVDHAPPEDVFRGRRCPDEEVSDDGRRGGVGVVGGRLPEQEAEPRAGGREPGDRRHREVQLECVRQQEHAVRRRPALQIDERDRVELDDEHAGPVIEHGGGLHVVGDAERRVDVGVAIAAVDGERADDGAGDDAHIRLREPQHALPEGIPLLDGEHPSRLCAATDHATARSRDRRTHVVHGAVGRGQRAW